MALTSVSPVTQDKLHKHIIVFDGNTAITSSAWIDCKRYQWAAAHVSIKNTDGKVQFWGSNASGNPASNEAGYPIGTIISDTVGFISGYALEDLPAWIQVEIRASCATPGVFVGLCFKNAAIT